MARSQYKPWAERIKRLRESLALNQGEFAQKLGTVQPTISAWEAGRQSPSAETYIRLSELAIYPSDALWFLQSAGLTRKKLLSIANELLREQGKRQKEQQGEQSIVSIPCLRDAEYIDSPALAPPEAVKEWLSFPAEWVPNRESTSFIKSDDAYVGSSYVLIDASQTDLDQLWDQTVLVHFSERKDHPEGWEFGKLTQLNIEGRIIPILTQSEQIAALVKTKADDLVPPPLAADPAAKELGQFWKEITYGLQQSLGIPVSIEAGDRIVGRVIVSAFLEHGTKQPKKGKSK